VERPLPAMLASSLRFTVSLLVSFLLVLLSSSVLSLTTSLMTTSLMLWCGLVLVSLTFSLTKLSPLRSLWISLSFSSFLSYSVLFEQRSWNRTWAIGWREMGSKVIYPSLLHAATVQHSVSVLSFHLDAHSLGRRHPYQIKMIHKFVQIVSLILSSTPNWHSPSLVSLPICLQAAQAPILSNNCFKIDTVHSIFSSNIEWG
jgi:hypothetical protein